MRLRIHWIDYIGPGRLATMGHPYGGAYLEESIRQFRHNYEVDVLVSALTDDDETWCELRREGEWCNTYGIEFIRFPILDHALPTDMQAVSALALALREKLDAGRSIVIHCFAGIGRATMLAAAVLISAGVPAADAIERIGLARGLPVPDTEQQREWIEQFERHYGVPAE